MSRAARSAAASLLSTATLQLVACTEPIPANVYVPGPGYRQSLSVSAELDSNRFARAGAPVVLHASWEAGPWQLVSRDSADLSDCWWRVAPPRSEAEAASSVTWRVAPSDSVSFNLPQPPAWERRVHFPRPGRYRLWAVAPGCTRPMQSDTLIIDVVEGRTGTP